MTSRSTRKSSQRERSCSTRKSSQRVGSPSPCAETALPRKKFTARSRVTRYHDHAWHEPSRQAKARARASVHPKTEPWNFVIFVSWGSNLSPAPSAWLDWLLPARLVFVTPVSLRGSALVFSPTPEPGYLGLAALREGNPLAFAFGFGLLPFPCRGSAKVLVPSPGKDLSRQRPLGGNAVTLTLLARSCNPLALASGSARSSCLAVSSLV